MIVNRDNVAHFKVADFYIHRAPVAKSSVFEPSKLNIVRIGNDEIKIESSCCSVCDDVERHTLFFSPLSEESVRLNSFPKGTPQEVVLPKINVMQKAIANYYKTRPINIGSSDSPHYFDHHPSWVQAKSAKASLGSTSPASDPVQASPAPDLASPVQAPASPALTSSTPARPASPVSGMPERSTFKIQNEH